MAFVNLLKEVEIDQAREAPAEIMRINHDSENKFEKSDEHMKRLSLKKNFKMLSKELHQEKYKATSVSQDTFHPVIKGTREEKVKQTICQASKDNKTTIT
ncbi:hypothetical protein TNCV_309591 [Trichonephila clavipes]|nr:hypothetical protein TNCV_309591 [Trichonephila clavipes]